MRYMPHLGPSPFAFYGADVLSYMFRYRIKGYIDICNTCAKFPVDQNVLANPFRLA